MSGPRTIGSGPRGRILHVDDAPAHRSHVTHVLESEGYDVRAVPDGPTALVEAPRGFDAVVLDVRLAGMDGYEVCRRLRATPATAATPVLLTSAVVAETGARVHALDAGADAYLVQPLKREELAATLRALLRARRAERDAERLAARLSDALRARDEFLVVAAHELRTPLTALGLELARMERRDGAGAVPPGDGPRIEAARRQLRRMQELIGRMLDVASCAGRELELRLVPADVSSIAAAAAAACARDARAARCELTVDAPQALQALCDPDRIGQALRALLDNALRFGAGKPVQLAVQRAGADVVLTVRDHGVGLSPEDAARVFERFERAAPLAHYGGLGLGLFVARHIVEAHGGTLAVTSSPGAGALFAVRFQRGLDAPSPGAAGGQAAG
jgi:signal transduction histidine kinase